MAPRTRAARPSLRARARGALAALVVGVLAATLGLGATGTAVADE